MPAFTHNNEHTYITHTHTHTLHRKNIKLIITIKTVYSSCNILQWFEFEMLSTGSLCNVWSPPDSTILRHPKTLGAIASLWVLIALVHVFEGCIRSLIPSHSLCVICATKCTASSSTLPHCHDVCLVTEPEFVESKTELQPLNLGAQEHKAQLCKSN